MRHLVAFIVCLVLCGEMIPDRALASPLPTSTYSASSNPARLPTERSILDAHRPGGTGRFYALNDLTHHVVRFDLRRGHWRTSLVGSGWIDPSQLAVTRRGTVWVIDAGARALVRISAGGRQRVVLRLSDPGARLVVDRAGNAYINQGFSAFKVSPSARTITRLGEVTDATDALAGFGVDADGDVSMIYPADFDYDLPGAGNVEVATFPASGGGPVIRNVDEFSPESNVRQVQVAPSGAIVMHVRATGGSGYVSTDLIPVGASEPIDITTKLSVTASTIDSRGLIYLLQWRKWCFDPAIGDGSCVPDDTVDTAVVRNGSGGYGTIPLTGLRFPYGGFAADAHGRLYVSQSSDTVGPLYSVAPGGGPAVPIIAGRFFALTVPYGH